MKISRKSRHVALAVVLVLAVLPLDNCIGSGGAMAWTRPKPFAKRTPSVSERRSDGAPTAPISSSTTTTTTSLHAKDTSDATTTTTPSNFWSGDKFNAAERQKFFQASKSGLAVSLAMVPEAGTKTDEISHNLRTTSSPH
jgi:hypothetical protein